jgi:Secretion system C-terminal sorting domain
MKKIIILLAVAVLGVVKTNAQCSPDGNNFEMKLVPGDNNTLTVKMRYNDGSVANAISKLPQSNIQLDGLVFAISWPTTSAIQLVSCKNVLTPFAIDMDKTVANGSANKTSKVADNIQTFYHTNTTPTAFGFNWENGTWYDVALIQYNGKLASGDFFSFINCDYGIAHPNSFAGNSHTDPWLAMFDNGIANYQQFSPKMLTEIPGSITNVSSFNIYPNPTSSELFIDIMSELNTQVVSNISDANGKVVKSSNFELVKGLNKNKMNLSELTTGTYFVKITDGKSLNFIQKVSKQ